ncbi:hypothetical protein D9M70_601730 [compost metagenome]
MPPYPRIVMAIENHTCLLRKASSSPRRPPPSVGAGVVGTRAAIPISATMPIAVIAQKVERHPNCWPSIVPNGTPRTLAMVNPENIIAIAPARLSGATIPAATTDPMPKNAP